jgi:hypothetical protein
VITTLKNNTLTAQIQHLGAELISLKSSQGKEYIWEEIQILGKTFSVLFQLLALKQYFSS